MKDCFNISKDSLTPNELMRAMLLSEVDLLWNGGIGTYVKASDERHPEVGDRANGAQLWWKPDWRSPQNYPGSGTFMRR